MDKNTLIGFLLIGVLVFGFTWYNQPSQADLERQRAYNDSIATVQMNEAIATAEARAAAATDSLKKDTVSAQQQAVSQFGAFAPAALGEEKIYTLENSVIRMQISSKGGHSSSVMLKKFFTGLETDGEKQPLSHWLL